MAEGTQKLKTVEGWFEGNWHINAKLEPLHRVTRRPIEAQFYASISADGKEPMPISQHKRFMPKGTYEHIKCPPEKYLELVAEYNNKLKMMGKHPVEPRKEFMGISSKRAANDG